MGGGAARRDRIDQEPTLAARRCQAIGAGVTRRLSTAAHSSAAEKRPAEAAWDWREETKRARTREDPRRAEARRKAEQREEADERRFHEERRLAGPVSFRMAFGSACRRLPMTLATRLQD